MPGLTVELVVNENGVPAPPVLVVGKKSNLIVPEVGVALPPVIANGSAVVFATARPVSNGGDVIAYGINIVVLVGRTLAIVTGPTSASVKHGYPLLSMGDPEASRLVVQTGAMVAVTLMAPGVVTAALLVSAMLVTSTSIVGVVVSDGASIISKVATFAVEVTVVVPDVVAPVTNRDVEPFTVKFSVTPVGMLVNVN